MYLKITLHSAAAEEIMKNYITFLDPGGINYVIIVGPTVRFQTANSVSFFGPHRVPGTELSEFLSAYYLRGKSELIEFFAELTEFAVKLSEAQ